MTTIPNAGFFTGSQHMVEKILKDAADFVRYYCVFSALISPQMRTRKLTLRPVVQKDKEVASASPDIFSSKTTRTADLPNKRRRSARSDDDLHVLSLSPARAPNRTRLEKGDGTLQDLQENSMVLQGDDHNWWADGSWGLMIWWLSINRLEPLGVSPS